MIGIIDYGAGNLRSVANALGHVGVRFRECKVPEDLHAVAKVVLPGVGHFGSAARGLSEVGMMEALRVWGAAGKPMLGICLGLQLFFEASAEAPDVRGLGLLPGRVVRLQAERVPHMGWNEVAAERTCPLVETGPCGHFYFAHAFVAEPGDPRDLVASTGVGGASVPAIVGRDSVWGVQFHPEKSGPAGLDLLSRFAAC